MRDVEVVRLRARRGDLVAQLVVGGALGSGDRVEVVAHADDLRRAVLDAVEAVDDGGVELHGVRLAFDVCAVPVADVPVSAPIHPDREPGGLEQPDRRLDQLGGDRVLLDDLHLRLDDEAAVESGERRP